jgi:hypothetical protein
VKLDAAGERMDELQLDISRWSILEDILRLVEVGEAGVDEWENAVVSVDCIFGQALRSVSTSSRQAGKYHRRAWQTGGKGKAHQAGFCLEWPVRSGRAKHPKASDGSMQPLTLSWSCCFI